MEKLIKDIENLFSKYENQIELMLNKKPIEESDHDEKENIEMQLNFKITKLEAGEMSDKYREYKYRLYKIQSSYLRATDKILDAEKIETIMADYEPLQTENLINQMNFPKNEAPKEPPIQKNNKIDQDQDAYLEAVSFLAKNEVISDECKLKLYDFHFFKVNVISKLSEYIDMNKIYKQLDIEISNKLGYCEIKQEEENNQNPDAYRAFYEIPRNLTIAKNFLDKTRVELTIGFMVHVKNSSKPEKVLFVNLQQYLEAINKRFYELSLVFHPDKMTWLDEKYKNDAETFYLLICNCKKKLTKQFENDAKSEMSNEDLDCHEEKGNQFFQLAQDYRKCLLQKWNEIKVLNSNQIPNLTSKEFQELSTYFAMLSYEEYKMACKIADRNKLFNKQIKLRENMALCFYMSDKLLEAQLIAISEILLLKKNKKATDEQRKQAKKLLDKLKCANETKENNQQSETSSTNVFTEQESASLNVNFDNTIAILDNDETLDEEIQQINEDLRQGLLVLACRENVRISTPKSELMKAKNSNTKKLMIKAAAYGFGSIGMGATVGIGFFNTFKEASIIVAGIMVGGSPLGLAIGITSSLLTILTSGFGCWMLFKKQKNMIDEKFKQIGYLENINKILVAAIKEHDNGNYMQFLKELSKPYNTKEKDADNDEGSAANDGKPKEPEKRLLKIDDETLEINGKEIIKHLLELNSAPDSIAYLLNLIANVLVSGKIKLKKLTFERLQTKACELLDQISCKELEDKANELDKKVSLVRFLMSKQTQYKMKFTKFLENHGLKQSKSSVDKEYVDDATEKGSFYKRLSEIKLVAKINTAILSIVISGANGVEAAEAYISEIKEFVNKSDSFFEDQTRVRLELLEFLFWIYTSRESPMSTQIDVKQLTYQNEDRSDQEPLIDNYITYLDSLIEKSNDVEEKIKLLNKKGEFFLKKAEQLEKLDKLECFSYFKRAEEVYFDSYKFSNNRNLAIVQLLKCLVKLKKFGEAYEFFCYTNTNSYALDDDVIDQNNNGETNDELYGSQWEYHLYAGIACRHLNKLDHAKSHLAESIRIKPSDLARKELNIVDRLNVNSKMLDTIEKRIGFYRRDRESFEKKFNFNNKNQSAEKKFKILSVDGGGIRGIIPSLLLCEIERRAHRPIVDMFDLVAGTSTGALIAAGLSMSQSEGSSKPIHYACDIFDFYVNKSKSIFQKSAFIPLSNIIYSYKYSDDSRKKIFQEIIGGNRYLNESICDIIITSIKDKQSTYLFSSYDAKRSREKNHLLVDALMASTAAPTYFKSYSIDNLGHFNDGGLVVNNPARIAYIETITKYQQKPENLFLLSLGTGNYVGDPFDLKKTKSLLYWAENIPDIMITGHENEVDSAMTKLLSDNYKRWQVYLDSPIPLDDCESIPRLIEIGKQFIEEEDDSINNIVKLLKQ